MNLKQQLDSTASDVNNFILSTLEGKPRDLYLASSHYVKSGGKRLRPFIVIKSCEMFEEKVEHVLPIAAAVEMIHNFTLVHDDIMDNDEVRHSVPTVHKYYGLPLAILAGDVLFSKAFQVVSHYGTKAGLPDNVISQLVSKLSQSCIDLSEGQAMDINMTSNTKFSSESQYIKLINKKTGSLFAVSCELGAICALANKTDIENLAKFGRNMGIAFQIVDDLIGVIGDPKVTKKPVGNDIREGKKTLPILLAIKKAERKEKYMILKVFGSKNASNAEIRTVVDIFTNIGVDNDVRKMARFYTSKALDILKLYNDSKAKYALQLLTDFIVERTL
tara:strand:+ start:430 stop:1425 length:996 start_codon:yes stop_codon:yes gene_type:complete